MATASYEPGYDENASHKQFMATTGRLLKALDAQSAAKASEAELAHQLATEGGIAAEKAGFGPCVEALGKNLDFSALFRANPIGYFFYQGFKQYPIKRENPRGHGPQAVAAFEAGKAAGLASIRAKKL